MSEPKYKIGDKFKDSTGAIHEILSVITTRSGEVKYWVDDNGDRDPWSTGELAVSRWEQISPFFEIGKVYRVGLGGNRYRIAQLRQVGGKHFAWAEYENYSGAIEMISLDQVDFGHMTEV